MSPKEIKHLRSRLGWSQVEMAQHLHVTPMTVSRWERGERYPDEYRRVVLLQLRGRLDEAEAEERRGEFLEGIATAALIGGVGFLLGKLFEGGPVEEEHERLGDPSEGKNSSQGGSESNSNDSSSKRD